MYTTANCTSGTNFDDVILCCDANCRHHNSTWLLTVKTESEADKIIYALVGRHGNADSIFKYTVIRGQEQDWTIAMDNPLDRELWVRYHNYCEGVRDALHVKFP